MISCALPLHGQEHVCLNSECAHLGAARVMLEPDGNGDQNPSQLDGASCCCCAVGFLQSKGTPGPSRNSYLMPTAVDKAML